MTSKRQDAVEEAVEHAGKLGLVDLAIGPVLQPRIGDLGRRDRVAGADRGWRHDAGEADELGPLVEADLLFSADEQVAVGQHIDHADGQGAEEVRAGRTGLLVAGGVAAAGLHVQNRPFPAEDDLARVGADLEGERVVEAALLVEGQQALRLVRQAVARAQLKARVRPEMTEFARLALAVNLATNHMSLIVAELDILVVLRAVAAVRAQVSVGSSLGS